MDFLLPEFGEKTTINGRVFTVLGWSMDIQNLTYRVRLDLDYRPDAQPVTHADAMDMVRSEVHKALAIATLAERSKARAKSRKRK
jgi:hypothetical protein